MEPTWSQKGLKKSMFFWIVFWKPLETLTGLRRDCDGAAPARASAAAIAANIALDYTLCVKCGLGALGLVAATAVVNGASALALLVGLGRRIGGLGLGEYARPAAVIAAAALAAALFSKVFASGVDACIVGSRHDRL